MNAIVGTFSKIPQKTTSHSHGWARTWSDNLKIPLDFKNQVHDVTYLLHGANHVGDAVNLFGGYTDQLELHIVNLLKSKEIISLEKTCPPYGLKLEKRKDVINKNLMKELQARLANIPVLEQTDLGLTWLTVGDSHSAAYSPPNSAVIKQDGTTLFGQIKSDFEYIRKFIDKAGKIDGVTISLGNIDIRHHILRNDADWRAMLDAWKVFGDSLGIHVEYSAPWPIEFEGRRLPKSGWYKGTAFYGSQPDRAQLVSDWIGYMNDIKMDVVMPPSEWYFIEPQQYADEYMEKPQSVHLNPMRYRRENWGKQEISLEGFFE